MSHLPPDIWRPPWGQVHRRPETYSGREPISFPASVASPARPMALALTRCKASRLTPLGMLGWLRSPGRNRVPVQSRSPDDGAPRPTVGAKCRGLGATYAKGWLIMVGASRMSPVPGNGMRRRHARRWILPSFRALRGDNTPTAALQGLRMITMAK